MTVPKAHLIGRAAPCTPEWHRLRESGLGGSEIAAVLGLSKWESRFSLWYRKQGRVPRADTPEMEWGRRLEPAVRNKFADNHANFAVGESPGTFANNEHPWMRANVDALVWEGDHAGAPTAIWEGKTAYNDADWGPDGTDQIPVYYRCQVLWYLAVLGLRKAYISVLISGCDYREYSIEINEATQAEVDLLVSEGQEFMESLPFDGRAGRKPDPDAHSETYQVIKRLPEGVDPIPTEVDPHLADAYLDSVDAYKKAKEEKVLRTNQILDAMGESIYAESLGRRIANRATKSDGTTHRLTPVKEPNQ